MPGVDRAGVIRKVRCPMPILSEESPPGFLINRLRCCRPTRTMRPNRPRHEPPQSPRCGQQHDPALPRPGICPRHHHRPHFWRRRDDRRVFCRLQDPQPAAPPVCRRRVLAGLCADSGRIPEPSRRRSHPPAGRTGCQRLDHRADHCRRARHRGGPVDCLRQRTRVCCRRRQVRTDGDVAAHYLPLHHLHIAGGTGGRHPEYLEPVFSAGLCPGAAQCGDDRCRPVACALFRPAGIGAGLGRDDRRRAPVGLDAAASGQNPHVAPPDPAL